MTDFSEPPFLIFSLWPIIVFKSLTRALAVPLHQILDVPEALRPGPAPDTGRGAGGPGGAGGGGGGGEGLLVPGLQTDQAVRPGYWLSRGHWGLT